MTEEVKDGGLKCYDCAKGSPSYMVRDMVWKQAFPDYWSVKTALRRKYPLPEREKIYIELCFVCLEKRLGRTLTQEDFDLTLPINQGIRLGMHMERDTWP